MPRVHTGRVGSIDLVQLLLHLAPSARAARAPRTPTGTHARTGVPAQAVPRARVRAPRARRRAPPRAGPHPCSTEASFVYARATSSHAAGSVRLFASDAQLLEAAARNRRARRARCRACSARGSRSRARRPVAPARSPPRTARSLRRTGSASISCWPRVASTRARAAVSTPEPGYREVDVVEDLVAGMPQPAEVAGPPLVQQPGRHRVASTSRSSTAVQRNSSARSTLPDSSALRPPRTARCRPDASRTSASASGTCGHSSSARSTCASASG